MSAPLRTAGVVLMLLTPTRTEPPAQAGTPRETGAITVPRMASAEAQLAHARWLKRQMAVQHGEALVPGRLRAIAAYQAVRLFHPGARAACVEAAFRAGEILRTAGDESGALAEFGWCVRRGGEGEFHARARLEIGHLHRRALRWREALDYYLDVAVDAAVDQARREDAWLWTGTAWKALHRAEDATIAWRRVADGGTDALARIQAFDELALLLLEQGELEGAAGVLDQCLGALSPRALEESETGERVRNALLRMRIVVELPRAIARRRDACVHKEPRESLDK